MSFDAKKYVNHTLTLKPEARACSATARHDALVHQVQQGIKELREKQGQAHPTEIPQYRTAIKQLENYLTTHKYSYEN